MQRALPYIKAFAVALVIGVAGFFYIADYGTVDARWLSEKTIADINKAAAGSDSTSRLDVALDAKPETGDAAGNHQQDLVLEEVRGALLNWWAASVLTALFAALAWLWIAQRANATLGSYEDAGKAMLQWWLLLFLEAVLCAGWTFLLYDRTRIVLLLSDATFDRRVVEGV